MGIRPSRGMLTRAALLTTCATAAACALPAASSAAGVTPASFTTCTGSLSPAATGAKASEPNQLGYSFQCDTGISAYSIIVDQDRSPLGAITDYNGSPVVYMGDGVTPAAGETVTCEGTQPSDGINCSSGTQNLQLGEYNFVDGSITLQQPYCAHLPTVIKGKAPRPGTLAVPTAKVQLVVTDDTGAQDGPFDLKLKKACPSVPAKVPAASTTAAPAKTSSKKTTSAHERHHRA